MDALSAYHSFARNTPQSHPIPGRETEMARNGAGGFSFTKDVWTRLGDFLILGTEGGTYYADERSHTISNVAVVRQALELDGSRAVALAVEISTARPARAPKPYPALYLVAAALATGDLDARRAAADAVPRVARTTDHLSHLFGYYKTLKGRPGRGGVGLAAPSSVVVRRAWANWFTQAPPDTVAHKILKAGQRKTGDGEAFTPGDLLRIAHPRPANPVQEAVFQLALGRKTPMEVSGFLASAKAFYEANRVTTTAEAVRAINAYHVPWEFLPDAVLKSPDVWEALVPHLGMTALIRNLSRMTTIGTLGPFRQSNGRVAKRLRNPSELAQGRIHPFDLLLAHRVYSSGRAQPHPNAPVRTWSPVGEVVRALSDAYSLAFASAERTDARMVIAVDGSGSMMNYRIQHGGSSLGSAYHVCSAVAAMLAGTCSDQTWLMEFDSRPRPSQVHPGMSLSEVFSKRCGGGATDLAAPVGWALANGVVTDLFVLLTDGETWAGQRHASQVLAEYRARYNPNARLVIASTTAAGYSVGDPRDPGVLNIAGFDSAVPTLVNGFARASRAAL